MATRVLLPREQVFSNIGIVGSGYRLFFYETGTITKQNTYSDKALTVENTNPVVADSSGRFGDIWISDSSLYRCVLAPAGADDPSTNPIWTADPINANENNIILIDPLPAAYWGVTSGTSTAYLLDIPNLLVPITSYTNKQCFFIDFHISCGATPTLNVNDLGTLQLKKYANDGTKVALEVGDIQVARYLAINDGSDIVILNPGIEQNLKANNLTVNTSLNSSLFANKQIIISNNVSDANNDIDFVTGIGSDIVNNVVFSLSDITKRLDAAWASGTGNGGLDTGSKASGTFYCCYAIYNPTTNTADAIFSAAPLASGPLLPTGYTRYAYVGTIRTDGSSNIKGFTQVKNYFYRNVQVVDYTYAVASNTTANLQTIEVPPRTIAILQGRANSATNDFFNIQNTNETDAVPTQNNCIAVAVTGASFYIQVLANSNSQIRYRADSTNISFNIISRGWIDTNL